MFAAGPIGTEIMVKGSGYMPMHEEGTKRLAPFYAENTNFKTSSTWYAFPGANQLKIIDVLKDNLQSVVSKSVTLDEALTWAAEKSARSQAEADRRVLTCCVPAGTHGRRVFVAR